MSPFSVFSRRRSRRGFTLVEAMVSMFLLATVLLATISTMLQSRKLTESSVMHAAASSLIYGIIEQIKMANYTAQLPSAVADTTSVPGPPTSAVPPYVKVRINQDTDMWLMAVYSPATAGVPNPHGPTTTPSTTAVTTDFSPAAIDNLVPALPLSSVNSGSRSQQLSMNIWLWIDEMPDYVNDVQQVKKMTLVYTYTYNDGTRLRTVREREVFVCSLYQQ